MNLAESQAANNAPVAQRTERRASNAEVVGLNPSRGAILTDADAWMAYPQHRIWFDKLWLSQALGYQCGPGSVAPPKPDRYVVRPIYNLYGMGAGASIRYIETGDEVPPGYFWCELFKGEHFTIDYKWQFGKWAPVRTLRGYSTGLAHFTKWRVETTNFVLPSIFNNLRDVDTINVEIVNNKIVEVHLRPNPDPDFKELIVSWADNPVPRPGMEWKWIDAPECAYIDCKRIGFWVR